MNAKLLFLPALCLGGAAFLLAPVRETQAFTKLGGSLGESQRDVRVFDNFADATADDNAAFATQFPGWNGVDLAIWKAVVEWGSRLHGDGTGDPLNGNTLGNGGANFDAFWAGAADANGNGNDNIMSAIDSCSSGVIAYCDVPIQDGWRIRFCEAYTWDDGPGTVESRMDIQNITAHEYGHALGLAHSGNDQATMTPSSVGGVTTLRSIHTDDIAGIQCIYGLASATKPVIVATVADTGANTLTIYGSEFGGPGNEVWFCPSAVTPAGVDPIVKVTGVSATSGGTVITVTIPAAAGPGDVIVNRSGVGHATVSNAFPTDLVGTFGVPPLPPPDLASVTPSTIDALIPGTAETITLTGTDLDNTSAVSIDQVPVDASRWTIVNATTITLDMPQLGALGPHDVGVSDGVTLDEVTVTVVAPAAPTLEWGNGDAGNVVNRLDGLDFLVAGPVGETHLVLSSNLGPPALGAFFGLASRFDDGPQLVAPGSYEIPSSGWLAVHIPTLPDPSLAGSTWHARSFAIVRPAPFAGSNAQSITLVP